MTPREIKQSGAWRSIRNTRWLWGDNGRHSISLGGGRVAELIACEDEAALAAAVATVARIARGKGVMIESKPCVRVW